MLAGPNGSGKSTFFERHIAKWGVPFVNPDVLALEIAPHDAANAGLRAARASRERCDQLLAAGRSFVIEGIRPDLRLIEEARGRGYFVRVIFVCVASPVMNISRVSLRVAQGGHDVPIEAISVRYYRALASLPDAARSADQLLLFDNSRRHHPHRLIARFSSGDLVTLRRVVPRWAQQVFSVEFERFRSSS